MKTNTLGWMMALGMVGAAFASCSQPKTECQAALASTGLNYAVKYKLKSQPSAACLPLAKTGEAIGMEFYHQATADQTTYDSTKTTMALQSDALGREILLRESLDGADECNGYVKCKDDASCMDPGLKCNGGYCTATSCASARHPWGLGTFASATPDANDFCSISTFSPAEQNFGELTDTLGAELDAACTKDEDCQIPADPDDPDSMIDPSSGMICDTTASKCVVGCRGGDTAPNGCVAPFSCTSTTNTVGDCKLAANSLKYEWTNVKYYVTAAAPGTQFSGDLKYTEDGCTFEYAAVGLWPAIECVDDLGCSACANPDAGMTIGSGISPDFPVKCDRELGLCVLKDAKNLDQDATSIPQILATSQDCGPIN